MHFMERQSLIPNLFIVVEIALAKLSETTGKCDVVFNKPYDEVLGAAQLIKLEIHLIV